MKIQNKLIQLGLCLILLAFVNLTGNCKNATPDTLTVPELRQIERMLPRINTDLKEFDIIKRQNVLLGLKIDLSDTEITHLKKSIGQAETALVKEKRRGIIKGIVRTGIEIVATALLIYSLTK